MESNHQHKEFQSNALTIELLKLDYFYWNKRIRTFKYPYQKRMPSHLAIFQKQKFYYSLLDLNQYLIKNRF